MSYRRLIVAFVVGFCVMVFELVAARLMSPVVGSSTYVWTSIIGSIIAAMSLGYWVGGVLADRRARDSDIAGLLLVSAVLMVWSLCQYRRLLSLVATFPIDIRLQATFAAITLFAPASFVLGALSPYLAKLQTKSLTTTGQSIASLSAINSVGGIVGTFIAGFFLFGWIGASEVLSLLILTLVVVSWLIAPRVHWFWRLIVSLACVLLAIVYIVVPQTRNHTSQTVDTTTAHYTVMQWQERDKTIRGLLSGPYGVQSGVNVYQPNQLAFWYTQQMAKAVETAPRRQRILVLGGGTFTLPRYLAQRYPQSQIDVVEIDEGLLPIARKHFFYDDPPTIRLIFQDARVYLERSTSQYDIVLVDVYNDGDIPQSLVTRQFAAALQQRLRPQARVIVNMIASRQPACLPLFAAQDAPYAAILGPGTFRYQLSSGWGYGNVVATYGGGGQPAPFIRQTPYDDNYVPLDRLRQACQVAHPKT